MAPFDFATSASLPRLRSAQVKASRSVTGEQGVGEQEETWFIHYGTG
ncbi:hypothetical protein [Nostoc punctiforme]|nr:hypothetical protein [Nostoc punctiforme]